MPETTSEVSSIQAIRTKIGTSLAGAFGIFLYGLITYLDLTSLENGSVESVNIWSPVKYFYENFGLYGALSPFLIFILYFVYKAMKALQHQRELIKEYGQDAFNNEIKKIRNSMPRIFRSTNENGKYPKSTIILASLMLAIFILVFLGVQFGFIR